MMKYNPISENSAQCTWDLWKWAEVKRPRACGPGQVGRGVRSESCMNPTGRDRSAQLETPQDSQVKVTQGHRELFRTNQLAHRIISPTWNGVIFVTAPGIQVKPL